MAGNMHRCPHCGSDSLPEAAFCHQCGRAVGIPTPSRGLLVFGLVTALLAGLIAAVFVARAISSHPPQTPPAQPPQTQFAPTPEPEPQPTPNEEVSPTTEETTAVEGEPVASEQAAIDLVMQREDVQEWMNLIAEARAEGKQRQALVEVTEETDTAYIVHVFESVEDEEPGHIATFGWYNVSKADGAISDANAP